MKTKNMFSIFAMAFAMLFIVGCGNSPKEVLEDWSEAILEEDFYEAKKYCTGDKYEIKRLNNSFEDEDFDEYEKLRFIAFINKYLNEDEEVTYEDDFASITPNDRPPLVFKKVNGKWKIYRGEFRYWRKFEPEIY